MCYNFIHYRLATDLSSVRGTLPTYPETLMVGIRSSKMTNTNRLASLKRTLKNGAIITTATACIIGISPVIVSPAFAGEVPLTPSRERILTALRLMSNDYTEYLCSKEIIRKESNFRTDARNGSHYGLAQGRSPYLRTATYPQQLHWYIKYIRARYGDGCKALSHHVKHNWY